MDQEIIRRILSDVFNDAEEWRPVIKLAFETITSYGPEAKEFLSGIVLGLADIKIAAIAKYEAAGFTREQAIFLVMDEWYAYARNARSLGSSSKK